jgi:hypothetical protein
MEALGDDAVGRKVGFRYRRAVGLAIDAHPTAIHLKDRRSGQRDQLGQRRDEIGQSTTVDWRG